jgi:hypothetical protein
MLDRYSLVREIRDRRLDIADDHEAKRYTSLPRQEVDRQNVQDDDQSP